MNFDCQPILNSDLVKIRPLRLEDYPQLFNVASDPLLWEQHPAKNRYEEKVFRNFFDEAIDSGGALIVINQQTQEVIGSSRFHGFNKEKSEVEIGWSFLARSHWGGIYNKEIKRLMLEHAFKFVETVLFIVGTENRRSQFAVEKIGGKRQKAILERSGQSNYLYKLQKQVCLFNREEIIVPKPIHHEISFNTIPQRLFEALTDAKKFSDFTGAPAEIDSISGGKFSCFGGMITGQTIEIIPSRRLVQAWCVSNWEPGIYSIVKFEFEKLNEMETKLIFDHTGFPEEHRSHLDQGWHERYWTPLKDYLKA